MTASVENSLLEQSKAEMCMVDWCFMTLSTYMLHLANNVNTDNSYKYEECCNITIHK